MPGNFTMSLSEIPEAVKTDEGNGTRKSNVVERTLVGYEKPETGSGRLADTEVRPYRR